MAAVIAALSAVLWGSADFGGGLVSRRMPSAAVVGWSQACALIVFVPIAVVVAVQHGAWPLGTLVWGVAAGLVGVCGLMAFYQALSIGKMGVVSPIASLGAIVPIVGGLLAGERLAPIQAIGMAAALAGVLLASGPELSGNDGGGSSRSVVLAVIAGVLFGSTFLCISYGAAAGGSLSGVSTALLTVASMRVGSVTLVGSMALLRGTLTRPPRAEVWPLVAIGLADASANVCFAYASTLGLTSVVAMLGSLYPVVTVLSARFVLGERLRPIQSLGVGVALMGVVMLSAG